MAAGGVCANVYRAAALLYGISHPCVRAVLFLISVHLKSSIRPLCVSRGVFFACLGVENAVTKQHAHMFLSNDPTYFVSSLFTDSLRDYFSKFGEIRECMVMRDPTTKRSR